MTSQYSHAMPGSGPLVLVAVPPGSMSFDIAGVPVPIRVVRQVRRAAVRAVYLVFAERHEAVRFAAAAERAGARAIAVDDIAAQVAGVSVCLRGDMVVSGDALREALDGVAAERGAVPVGFWLSPRTAAASARAALARKQIGDNGALAVAASAMLGHVSDAATAARLERALLRTLARPQDPNVTRLTGRRFSTPVSLRLARAGVSANAVTIFGILFGAAAAILIGVGDYWLTLCGSLVLVASRLLDDCDGEVARLTVTQSHAGERLDITSDIVVHTAAFLALTVNALRADPDGHHLLAFALVVIGGAIATVLILGFVSNTDLPQRSRLLRAMETSASGDFAYIVLLFALIGGTRWFLWLAAIGAQFFWMILAVVIYRHSRAGVVRASANRGGARYVEWALVATGLYILVALVRHTGMTQLIGDLSQIGWGFALICMVEGLPFVAATLAWRSTLSVKRISFPQLLAARLVGDSVNHLTPTATLGGEVLRARLVDEHLGREESTASVALAKFAETAGQLVFVLIGLLLITPQLHALGSGRWWLFAGIAACALGIVALARLLDRGLFTTAAATARRLGIARVWLARRSAAIVAIDTRIRDGIRRRPAGLMRSVLWFAFAFAVSVVEVWLVMHFLGVQVSWSAALGIEVLSVIVDGVFFFMPGKLGTQEGGKMLAFTLFGLPPEKGLAMGFIRRGRELFWDGVGLAVYAVMRARASAPRAYAEAPEQRSAAQ